MIHDREPAGRPSLDHLGARELPREPLAKDTPDAVGEPKIVRA